MLFRRPIDQFEPTAIAAVEGIAARRGPTDSAGGNVVGSCRFHVRLEEAPGQRMRPKEIAGFTDDR